MTHLTYISKEKFGSWALVTGASSGIGAEFARQLAASGLNLVLVARREHKLEGLGQQLALQFGIDYRVIGLDLSTPDFMETILAQTADLEIGLLVSNAGSGLPGEFLKLASTDLHNAAQLNVFSHLHLTHHFGQQFVKRRRGGILLVSAMGALQGLPYMANDSASKSYITNLGEALNVELRKSGVYVSVLIPGATDTPIVEKFGMIPDMMPMKPMPVDQCVAEALTALNANKSLHISGRINRFINFMMPRPLAVKMNGTLLAKAVANLEKQRVN